MTKIVSSLTKIVINAIIIPKHYISLIFFLTFGRYNVKNSARMANHHVRYLTTIVNYTACDTRAFRLLRRQRPPPSLSYRRLGTE